MSGQDTAFHNPFDGENPARARAASLEPPPSIQSPDQESVEELTRGKPRYGKIFGPLAVVGVLGALGYLQFFMPTKHKAPTASAAQYAPSDHAGDQAVNAAREAGNAYEKAESAHHSGAAAQPFTPGKGDPNAVAQQAIGSAGGSAAGNAGAGYAGAQSGGTSQQASEAMKAEREAAEKAAEKQAAIDAAPIQVNDVDLMPTQSPKTTPTSTTSSPEALASNLGKQLAAGQDSMNSELDKVAQLAGSYGGQAGAASTATPAGQQDHWLASLKADDGEIVHMHDAPAGPLISEGTPVRAVLLTGLNTDNPGTVSAMVTSNVYDSLTGTILLIPKGSKLTGVYNHDVRVGQDRVLIAMTRLIRPDLSWIDLSNATGSEDDGTSGVEGDVNNHFFKIFGSALVIGAATLLLDKTQQSITVNQGLGTTQMGGTIFAQTLQQVVSQLLARNQNIPPTITREGGTQFIFMLRHDLALTPYRGS